MTIEQLAQALKLNKNESEMIRHAMWYIENGIITRQQFIEYLELEH